MLDQYIPTFAAAVRVMANPWLWKMAWRDSRASRARLLVFSCSIMFGVTALVAISSLGENFKSGIDDQAKALLGADLVIASRNTLSPEAEAFLAGIPGVQARETIITSMAFFPKADNTRLVQIHAVRGGFPFYGVLETAPAEAVEPFRNGQGALVEESLMMQFGGAVGDDIRLGELTIPIAGILRKAPGESFVFATVAPRVYISESRLTETKLLRRDSLARYRIFYQLPADTDPSALIRKHRGTLSNFRLSSATVEDRKKDIGRSAENLAHYLNLGAFVALLLGAIGIGSAMHVHIKQKLATVAILRCLGTSAPQTLWIYVLQAASLGAFGSLLGAVAGVSLQFLILKSATGLMPVPIRAEVAWVQVTEAVALGFAICLLFALIPLLGVRRVSPLLVIRSQESSTSARDPLRFAVFFGIGFILIAFGLSQTAKWWHGLSFAGGIVLAFLIMAGAGKLIVAGLRRANISWLPYVWRQGLDNLHRPQNRTVLLMLSLGLGTFLMLTLYLVQRALSTDLLPANKASQANAVLFDIQTDQLPEVRALLGRQALPVLQEVPIVTMRLASIKGVTPEKLLKDPNRPIPSWVLRREYRSTHRPALIEGEVSLAGQWPAVSNLPEVFPVSVEEGIAKDLKVVLGDELQFDVQGVPVRTVVANVRKVDWRRMQPNFFFVFPPKALEGAPAFHVIVTRVPSPEVSGKMQREVVKRFPNISTLDLTLILQTVDSVLEKIALVLRFMAIFTVGAGLFVLSGSVISGRYQRIQESVLLRTLGASKKQILLILLAEYACLGLVAAATGVVLAQTAAWALVTYVFETPYHVLLGPAIVALVATPLATVIIGLAASAQILNHPPLEVLRKEG